MVTLASRTHDWERASYLDLDGNPRAPQAIAALLPQVLARYALPVAQLTADKQGESVGGRQSAGQAEVSAAR